MDFEKCTLVELRQFAKEKGIKNVSKLKKDELIAILSEESKNENSKAIELNVMPTKANKATNHSCTSDSSHTNELNQKTKNSNKTEKA